MEKEINNKQKLFFLTFGGGTKEYHQAVKRICNQAKMFDMFDEIIGLTDEDLKKDKDFWEKHKDFILKNKRGYGYWIWRPYLINKIMNDKMNNGDIILFLDAGCEFNVNGKQIFSNYIEMTKKYDRVFTQIRHIDKTWTKMDLINHLDANKYINTGQLQGGIQIYIKNEENMKLLNEIYYLCIKDKYHYVDDSTSIEKNDTTFIEHRHEQSIVSLIIKKYGNFGIIHENEVDFFPNWENGKNYPILAMKNRTGITKLNFNNIANIQSKKTIIFTFMNTVANLKSYESQIGVNMWGFGDLLRGAIAVYKYAKNNNFDFYIDMQHHILSKYLELPNNPHKDLIKKNKDNINFILSENFVSFINNHHGDEPIYLLTNLVYNTPTNNNEKLYFRELLNPNQSLQKKIKDLLLNVSSNNYEIVHCRLNDSEFTKPSQDNFYLDIYNKIKSKITKNTILLSNSQYFKNYMKKNYPEINQFETKTIHIGNKSSNDEGLCDTLAEFFILSKAQKIYTYSVYSWISGFVKQVAEIYDVPVFNLKTEKNLTNEKYYSQAGEDKYYIKEKSKQILYNTLKKYKDNSKLFKITDLGIILDNYKENNHKLFRIDDKFLNTNSLPGIISYYLNHNRWKVQNQKNDTLDKLNKTLVYALKTVGTLYEIKLTDNGPNYTLYTNTDFVNENGFFIDGNVKYNTFEMLYRWIVYVTDYFNLYYIYYYKKGENKTIYLNRGDCPILPKNKINEIDSNFPIYSWTTTKEHADVLLPFPDIIMWLFKREFYNSVNPLKFLKYQEKTNNKCVFRGNMTNELRIKAHVISNQNNDIFDLKTSIGNPKLIFSNNQMIIDHQNIENFSKDSNHHLSTTEQQEYKYILNIDGIASAWRIISELYYNSIIFMHESPYIDVIRESLQKNIHYVELNHDLSNIKEIYKFISNNSDLSNNIIKNVNILSQKLDNIDIHMKFMYEKIEKKNYKCTYTELINCKYEIPQNIQNEINPKENLQYNNIYVNWMCYLNREVFSKPLEKNMNENKNKYVLCRPEAGFVDMMHAISTCYKYCQTVGRNLLIDVSNSTTYKINFSDIFEIFHNKKFLEPNIIYDLGEVNKILKKTKSIYPNIDLNEKTIYLEETHIFYDKNNIPLNFDLNKDYEEDILIYQQHRSPYDKLNDYFLKNIKLKEKHMEILFNKYSDIPKPYIAIHIRNTDMKSDYVGFYEKNKRLISQFDNVYLATDSIDVLNYFKDNVKNLFYYTQPREDNQPIHYNHNDEIKIFIDLLTDIFICGEANNFISGNMRSGFSQFIQYIREKSIVKSIFNTSKFQNKIIPKNINNKEKILFLSFGGGSEDYHQAVARIGKQAETFGIFDEILCYTESDLQKDKDFWDKHGNFISNNKRGYGYWIWKPYLIHKVITEKMNDGDIIVYIDAGCEMNIYGKKRFSEYIELVKQNGTLAFQMDLLEKEWTKMDLLKILQMDNENTGQIQATMQFYKRNTQNVNLINQIYKLSTMMNYRFVNDSPSIEKNDGTFKEHRHEQSILSLLFKKNKCFYIKDETYFHPNWENGIDYPIWTIRNKTGKSYLLNIYQNLNKYMYLNISGLIENYYEISNMKFISANGHIMNNNMNDSFSRRFDVVVCKNKVLFNNGQINNYFIKNKKIIFEDIFTLYIKTDYIDIACNIIDYIYSPFIFISSCSDYSPIIKYKNQYEKIINNKYLKKWYMANNLSNNDKVMSLPQGLWWYNKNIEDNLIRIRNNTLNIKKINKIFCSWRDRKTNDCGEKYVTRNRIKNFCLKNNDIFDWFEPNLSIPNYHEIMATYKYVLCVLGNGVDTSPKSFEAIILNTVPIIFKNENTKDVFDNLPVILINDEIELLDKSFLENKYDKIKKLLYNDETLNYLTADYWENKIKKCI